MPEEIDRTIYKLELDDSGYIRGVESMAASTAKLTEQQQKANQTLQTNQAALKNASEVLKKAKQDLDNYTGTNVKYQEQLKKDFANAQTEQKRLTDLVATNQKAYEKATKAAQDFADVSKRATGLQQQTTGGKIPTGASLTTPIPELPKIDFTNLSGLPQILTQVSGEFKKIADAVEQAKQRLTELGETDPEFQQLTEFIKLGEAALQQYNDAVELASESTDELSQRIATAQTTISKINTANVEQLPVEIAKSAEQFNELADAVALAEQRLKEMKPGDSGFDELAKTVAQGRATLQQYDTAVKGVSGNQVTLRTQLRLNREELVRLEQAGKGATTEYRNLELQTAKLTDEFNDQQARIRILASDTKLLDFGKGAITAATSAFQAYTSVAILAGDQSEDLQKKTMQLFAAMQLLQSLEQLSNLTRREGILSTLGLSGATSVYNAVVGKTTGSLKAFRLALLGTGIGAALVVIGLLVKKFQEHAEAMRKVGEEQKRLNEITNRAADAYANAQLELTTLTERIKLAKQGYIDKEVVLKEYNETIGKTVGATTDLDTAEQLLIKHGPDYIQLLFLKAKAQAAGALAAESAKKAIEDETKDASSFVGFFERIFTNDPQKQRAEAKKKALKKDEEDTKAYFKTMEDIQAEAADFAKTHGLVFEPQTTTKDKKNKALKDIKDDFEQRKKALLDAINDLEKVEFETEISIRAKFSEKLKKAIADINVDKSLKPKERVELIELAVKLNTAELDKELEDLNKRQLEARKKLDNELLNLQNKANQDSLNLLQDEFDRRRALIDFNETRELADQKTALEERLKNLEFDRLLIGEEEYQKARQILVTTGEQEVNNIIKKFSQERQDLSAAVFKETLDAYEKAIENIGFIEDKRQSEEVQKEADRFLRGEINYETFQKKLDEINKRHIDKRNEQTKAELEKEIEAISARLATIDIQRPTATIATRTGETPAPQTPQADTTKEVEDLTERRKKKQEQLSALNKADAEADAKNQDEILKGRLDVINKYASVIGELANSVISFWQVANEAEQKALDRSIAIQQRRVDEAQKIAERGNATYLKQETDRLKELQIQRENAARKQLAVDAALQASQILVGITGAIAKIASTPSGPLAVATVISEIAVIIGALATGYGLVKSLQGNQPRLRHGTTEVKRGKNPSGTDTIPAWLDEGEAVIPKKTNKKYKKSIEAIYHEKVPADELNEFVTNYTKNNTVVNRNTTDINNNTVSNKSITATQLKSLTEFVHTHHQVKPIPQPNYEKIKEVNEIKITHDGKLASIMQEHSLKLDENNRLQKEMLRALRTNKIDVHYDAEGLAVRQKEIMDQMEKNKRL